VNGIGAVVGGLISLRYRPSRPMLACVLWPTLVTIQLAALALHAPVWVLACASFFAGLGIAIHLTLWFTVFQREVPEHAQSRVSSYDALGSFVLTAARDSCSPGSSPPGSASRTRSGSRPARSSC